MLLFVIDKWRIEVGEQRMLFVFLAKQCFAKRKLPINAKSLVGYANAAVSLGVIEIVAFILENGFFAQHGKTMGKTLRNEKLTVIIL